MAHAEILITNLDGGPGSPVQLDGDKVELDARGWAVYIGDHPGIQPAMDSGVRIGRKVWYPKDGLTFLKRLPVLFNGSYVRARYVP